MDNEQVTAIILAAGQGNRMKTSIKKQYIEIEEKPLLVYPLKVLENCQEIKKIILVVSPGDINYCKDKIINKYGISKVSNIIEGGKERFHSVYNALNLLRDSDREYILIHDGARPLITESLIKKSIIEVKKNKACVIGVPVKDTIKKSNDKGYIVETVERNKLWSIQTPQTFELELLKKAYKEFMKNEEIQVTDDSMIVERYTNEKVKVIMGDYNNIKVTTQEDLIWLKTLLKAGKIKG